jgi:hypothetical protein
MPTSIIYPFDPTGRAATNLIANEQHVVTNNNYKNYYFIVPNLGPFFAESIVVSHKVNGNTVLLTENVDYYPVLPFIGATRSIGMPVFGGISFTNLSISGIVTVTYQTLGGDWTYDDATVLESIANQSYNPSFATWEQVTGLPTQFPVVNHEWNLVDMVGETELIESIVSLEQAILSRPVAVDVPTTKASIGLGNVENYPPATALEAITGTSTQRVITPATLKAVLNLIDTGASNSDLTALTQAISATSDGLNVTTNALSAHTGNTGNPHNTTAAQVGLGNVENIGVVTDAELTANTAVRKVVTFDQLLKTSTGAGQYKVNIDLLGASPSRFYPVYWFGQSLIRAGGVIPEITIYRKTDDTTASASGAMSLSVEQVGSIWDGYTQTYSKVKFFSQTGPTKFIKCFKHGIKSIYRNMNKNGTGLANYPGTVSGTVDLAGPKSGLYLRGGFQYEFVTNNLVIKNSVEYINNDIEKEIYYAVQSNFGFEGGWYARSYSENDLFLENFYTSMSRDDAYFSWNGQPSVYTFDATASATFTWASSNVTILGGATPTITGTLTLLPGSANLRAVTTFTKQASNVVVTVNTLFTSSATGTYALSLTPALNAASGDVFNYSTVVTRVDNGDTVVTSSTAVVSAASPVLNTTGTASVYLNQTATVTLNVASFTPNTALALKLFLVNPAGVKSAWVDANNTQYVSNVTTNGAGAATTTVNYVNNGALVSGVWSIAFEILSNGTTYTSSNQAAITIVPTSVTVSGTGTAATGTAFSIAYSVAGFEPNVGVSGTPYLVNPSGTRVSFASATAATGVVNITPMANGTGSGNITGSLLTTAAIGTWRVGLDVVAGIPGGTKTVSSVTLGTLNVIAVNASTGSSLTANRTVMTSGEAITYTGTWAGLTQGTNLYRIEFGTTLNNAAVVTESIAVTPNGNGAFTISRAVTVGANNTATLIYAYAKLIRISDNAVLVVNDAPTAAILAPGPTGRTWAPDNAWVVPGSNTTFNGAVTGLFGAGRYTYRIEESMEPGGGQTVVTTGAINPDANGNWNISRATTIDNSTAGDYFRSKLMIIRVSDGATLNDTGFQTVNISYPVPTVSFVKTGGANPVQPGQGQNYRVNISNIHGSNKYHIRTYFTVNGGAWQSAGGENITSVYTHMDRGYTVPLNAPSGTFRAYAEVVRNSDNAVVAPVMEIASTIQRIPTVTSFTKVDDSGLYGGTYGIVYLDGSMTPNRFLASVTGLEPSTSYTAGIYRRTGNANDGYDGFAYLYVTPYTTDANGNVNLNINNTNGGYYGDFSTFIFITSGSTTQAQINAGQGFNVITRQGFLNVTTYYEASNGGGDHDSQ